MKVTFHVTKAQAEKLHTMIEVGVETNKFLENGHFPFNGNQCVRLAGLTLLIEGERCALWQGGFEEIMLLVKKLGLNPLVYQTSVAQLAWHETMGDMLQRLPILEALEEAYRMGVRLGGSSTVATFYDNLDDHPEVMEARRVAKLSPARRNAEMTAQELRRHACVLHAVSKIKKYENTCRPFYGNVTTDNKNRENHECI